jgi:hypothetical protein
LFLRPVALQWLRGFGKRKVEVRSVWFRGFDRASSSCRSFNLPREQFLSAPIHSPPLWSPNRSFKWGNINNHFPWFDDARSIWFAISTNGVTHSVTRARHITPGLSCCCCITFHPDYARNRNIWCWQYWSPSQSNLVTVLMSTWGH